MATPRKRRSLPSFRRLSCFRSLEERFGFPGGESGDLAGDGVEARENENEHEYEQLENDGSSHEQLIQLISSLDKRKRKKRAVRTEPSSTVSEVNLKPQGDDKVSLSGLVSGLKPSAGTGVLKKKLARVEKAGKPIQPPLSKPQAERVQRSIAYVEASEEIGKWQEIVKKNREADHLEFPLRQQQMNPPAPSTGAMSFQMKPTTSLEKEIAALIQGPGAQHNLSSAKNGLTRAEERALKAMDLEKAMERREELQKIRALQSYFERKTRRQNKIKSKKFRRLKKRASNRAAEKMSNGHVEETELEKAEAIRVKERMTLRHHNKSKWAKSVISRGQKDPAIRRALSEQLKLGKELSQKSKMQESEDEDEPEQDDIHPGSSDEDRPPEKVNSGNVWLSGESRKTKLKAVDFGGVGRDSEKASLRPALLDPSKVLTAIESDDEGSVGNMADVIEEAFANDDVIDEFLKDKEDDMDEQRLKVVDLSLPGWGAWGGLGVDPRKKSSKRFAKKAPDVGPRQDEKLPHVIIREQPDKKLKKHVVADLPFPFTSREQFEKSLCAPIGRHWNTEMTFHESIRPHVETLMGNIIEPMEKGKDFKAKGEKQTKNQQKTLGSSRKRRRKKEAADGHKKEKEPAVGDKDKVLLTQSN